MNVADAFIDSANTSIVSIIEYNCSFEEPWDGEVFTDVFQFQRQTHKFGCIGFGGLVSIGDSVVFREEGLLTALATLASSLSHDSHIIKPSKSRAASSLGSARSTEAHRIQVTAINESMVKKPKEIQKASIPEPNLSVHQTRPTSSLQRTDSFGNYGHDRRVSRSRLSNARSTEIATLESRLKPQSRSAPKSVERVISNVERFKSRLIAVRSEGLPARESMVKCAAIADDAFTLAIKKLKRKTCSFGCLYRILCFLEGGEYSDACLLAAVADSACPESAASAKNKILKLKQSAMRGLKSSSVV